MDLHIRHSEVNVPTGGPADGRGMPLHAIGEVESSASVGVHKLLLWLIGKSALPIRSSLDLVEGQVALVNAVRLNFKANDTECFTKKYV